MRLTLRNLLAYMDGNLEPEDSEDIKKKIQESEFATKLEQHIRDVISRVRLSTPDVEGETGLDPNTVAEYLDHELPDERVPDFEKICLESDAHLAEVVASHQILALVLGSPAEVPDATRERMVALPEQARAHAGPPAPPRQSAAPDVSDDDEVILPPELVEASRASQGGKVFLGLIAIVAVVIVLFLTGNLPWTAGEPDLDREIAKVEGELDEELENAEGLPVNGATDRASNGPTASPAEEHGGPDVTPPSPLVEEPEGDQPVQGTGAPADTSSVPILTAPRPADRPSRPEDPTEETGPVEGPSEPAGPEVADPGETVGSAPSEEPEGEIKQPVTAVAPPSAEDPETSPAAPIPPTPVGQLVTDNAFLMIFDVAEGLWRRVVSNQILKSGDRLLAIPPYTPKILVGKVVVTMHPGAEIQLLAGERDGSPQDPGLEIVSGDVIIHPQVGARPAPLLRMGGIEEVLSLDDAVSAVAAAVSRSHQPGTDPVEAERELHLRLVLLQGTIHWGDREIGGIDAANLEIDPINPNQEPVQLEGPPEWNGGDPRLFGKTIAIEVADRIRRDMAKGAAEGKTVELVLAEIANDEKATRDARAVAAHALAYMGQYSPLIGMLDDERFRPNWESIVAHLREAASSDPEHAARIHDALKGAYPPGAEFLYRQLWGYTKEQLNNEGIALLDGLDSSILAVRVMSIQTLGNVLGRRLFSYNPTGTSSQRQQWIQSYRPRAQSGTLWKEVDETGGAEPEGPADRIRRAVEGAQ